MEVDAGYLSIYHLLTSRMRINNASSPLWKIQAETFSDLLRSDLIAQIFGSLVLYVLGAIFVIAALFGFSFYLWYLKSNNET